MVYRANIYSRRAFHIEVYNCIISNSLSCCCDHLTIAVHSHLVVVVKVNFSRRSLTVLTEAVFLSPRPYFPAKSFFLS
jgi:hypothetical protein